MAPSAPLIFDMKARRAKRRRAAGRFADHQFMHERAADDVIDRLESVLRHFERGIVHGPGAGLVRERLTDAADVGDLVTADDLPGEDLETEAAALPLEDDSIDLAVSFMALHAAYDPLAVLRELRRVLRPDGLVMAILPGERTLHELRAALRTAESNVTGGMSPRVAPMMAVRDGGSLLQAAGFALPVADVDRVAVEYTDPARLFSDLRGTGETSNLLEGPKGALRRDVLMATITAYREQFPGADGGIRATVDLIALTGWKPHASQPQPLKPGSATASMSDAMKKQVED